VIVVIPEMFLGIIGVEYGISSAKKFYMREQDKTCAGRLAKPNSSISIQLENAISVMNAIDDLTFRRVVSGSSVGQQFRHVLDVVNRLLEGAKIGRIDFSNRRRDTRVETDREFAIAQFEHALFRGNGLSNISGNTMVSVRSEVDPAVWLVSSLGREVEYVTSHSIHHYALIAEKLATLGIRVADSFGVAPSTLEYRERLAA
jgi:hypothetical protein